MLNQILDSKNEDFKKIFYWHSFLFFFIFNWRIVTILFVSAIHQHGSAIGIHMSSPSWTSLPPPTPSDSSILSQSPGLSSLSHTVNPHWRSILHMLVYVSMLLSPLVPPSPSYPPHTCPLCLHLHCCKEFHQYIFLDSIYMHQYMIFVYLFLTYFTLHNRLLGPTLY